MEHISKIHEEFNMIKMSIEAFQYWRGRQPIILNSPRAIFASNTGAPRGTVLVNRFHLRRNTQLESSVESHWNKFSLVACLEKRNMSGFYLRERRSINMFRSLYAGKINLSHLKFCTQSSKSL